MIATTSTGTPLAEAVALAAKGLRLFPLRQGTKKPAAEGWQKDATTNPSALRNAAAQFAGGVNFGLPMGNGYLAVDLDCKGGVDGEATLRALVDEAGEDDLPPTWTVRTPSGGLHLIFRGPDVPNSAGKLGPGVDVRSAGGYVVAVGAVLSGGVYRWAGGRSPADLPEPAACPPWLLALMGKATAKATDTKTPAIPGELMDEPETVERAVAYLKAQPAPVEGSRNVDLFKLAAHCKDLGLTEPTVQSLMWDYNTAIVTPPLEAEELTRTVQSAFASGQNAPGSRHPAGFGFEPVEIAPREETVVRVSEDGAVEVSRRQAPERRRLRLERFDEVEPDLNRPQLVRGILHPGTFSVLYGPPNEGKSFVALSLAVAIATGEPWLGHETAKGSVVYCALEGGGGIKARFKGFRQEYDLDGQGVPLDLLAAGLNLRHKDDVDALLALLAERPPALLIVDTLSRALAGGDENSSVDMGALVATVDHIIAATGASVILLHHVPRDAVRPRGHGSLDAAADTLVKVEKGGPIGRITVTKQRDMAYAPPIGFRLVPVTVGKNSAGEVVTSCVVERAGSPSSGKPLRPGGQHEKALALLSRLSVEQGEPQEGAIPPGLPMVPLEVWKTTCSSDVFADLSDEAARVSFNRVKRELGTRGYIVAHQEWCGVAPQ